MSGAQGADRSMPGEAVEESVMDPLRILVVDDEPVVLEVILLVLQSLGHDTTGLTSPGDAVRALEDGLDVDLVLTDYTMPGMTGLTLAEVIRRRWPEVGLGLVTSVGRTVETSEFRVFDLVVPKPLDIARLHAELARYAERRRRR